MLSETEKKDRATALADAWQREYVERLERQDAWLKSSVVSILVLSNKGVSMNNIQDICQHTLNKQMKLEAK